MTERTTDNKKTLNASSDAGTHLALGVGVAGALRAVTLMHAVRVPHGRQPAPRAERDRLRRLHVPMLHKPST